MYKPRGLSSNKPSVHIDKDRGNEAIVLARRSQLQEQARECDALIERINSSCGGMSANDLTGCDSSVTRSSKSICPQETYTFPGEHIAGYIGFAALVAMTIVVVAYAPRAKAQAPTIKEIVAPPEVFCSGAQKHIKNVLSKTGMFKDAFALSGEGARQVSQNIFNHNPPADHIIIFSQTDGKSVSHPCVWGKSGPEWDGTQSNRVAIDFVFRRDLEEPKTEISDSDKPRKTKK